MKKIEVVAILEMSAGNDYVGEMWQETKVFSDADEIGSIFEWAQKKKRGVTQDTKNIDVENFHGCLKLTVKQ